jgi:DNA polymerase III subunit beta
MHVGVSKASWINRGRTLTEGEIMTRLAFTTTTLKDRLRKISPFMAKDDNRPYLQGVFIKYEGNGVLTMAATTGHILCEMKVTSVGYNDEVLPFDVILSSEAVSHLLKMIPSNDELVEMHVEINKRIVFEFKGKISNYSYTSNSVDGLFPDYQKVIPEGTTVLKEGLRAEYLVDVLKALDEMPVDIKIDDVENAATAPHLFTSCRDQDIRCVIMPTLV